MGIDDVEDVRDVADDVDWVLPPERLPLELVRERLEEEEVRPRCSASLSGDSNSGVIYSGQNTKHAQRSCRSERPGPRRGNAAVSTPDLASTEDCPRCIARVSHVRG